MSTAAVILAGGASRRMGSPKALLTLHNETFLDRLIGLFQPVCSQIIVVFGHNAETIRAGLRRTATFVVNPDPERGQLSSLQCGFAALTEDVDRLFFTPVDYPGVRAETVSAIHRLVSERSPIIVVPQRGGKHGHPVLIARQVAEEILALPLSASARDVIHRHKSETAYIDVDDPGILLDVDDPEAYRVLTQAVV